VSGDLEKILTPRESKVDDQVAKLENDLQDAKDSRHTERFVWSFLTILLIDMIAFPHIAWGPALFLGFMELILLTILAKMSGIDEIYTILQNGIDAMKQMPWVKGGN
jgi:hypothetical protein